MRASDNGDFHAFVAAVKDATRLEDVVRDDVDLATSGTCLKGLSPFRQERTPSFVVWPDSQVWRDYSGGGDLGGDVFAYLMEKRRLTFKEALLELASRVGLQAPGLSEEQVALLEERRALVRILDRAATYYQSALTEEIRVRWYREHYGFTDETIARFRLGWADGGLWSHLAAAGIPREDALKTGLFVVLKDGDVVDFFQGRLVFPYVQAGQVAYFIARKTDRTPDKPWEDGKYKKQLTRSERHDYVSAAIHNDIFFNEDAARAAGGKALLVTEGVTDCISAEQAGFRCISPATTRFRHEDLPKLLALTARAERVILCNDAEESGAGLNGAMATADAFDQAGRHARIATLPRPEGVEKVDVNSFLKDHAPEDLGAVLDRAARYLEACIRDVPDTAPKLDLDRLLAPILARVGRKPPAEADAYLDLVRKRFHLGRRVIRKMLTESKAPVEETVEPERTRRVVRGLIREEGDAYVTPVNAEERHVISSFRIVPVERVRLTDGELFVGDVVTERGAVLRRHRFPPSAWHSRRNFLASFASLDMQWTGSDDHVQGLLRLLSAREVPERQGVSQLGLLDTADGPRWVAPDLTLGPDGPVEDPRVVFVSNGASLPGRVGYRLVSDDEARNAAHRILPRLLQLNETAVILPVIGWFFATPFRPRIMAQLKHFPILMVWGTQGSGKSSIIKEIFWPLFGLRSTDPFSATETEFALLKLLSSTNAVPVFIDEYKPSDMAEKRLQTLHRYLRRLYGGEVEERGTIEQTVTTHQLAAPVCLAGEARPQDPALVDRMVSVTPDRNHLERHPEHTEAFFGLQSQDLGLIAVPYLRFALGRDTPSDLVAAIRITDAVLASLPEAERCSLRCRDNLRVTVFGLSMFGAFAERMGVDLPEVDLGPVLSACITEVMDGEKGGRSPLDAFVETCSTLAHNGILVENRHYAMINGLTCLHLRSCFDLYLEHLRRTGQPEDTNGLPALRRLLRESRERTGYVHEIDKLVDLGGRRVRTVALDLEEAGHFLDVDPFPISQNRTWGGNRFGGEEP